MVGLRLLVLPLFLTLGGGAADAQDSGGRVGVPYDWSHRHTAFSRPDTFERQSAVQTDARYWHGEYRKGMPLYLPSSGGGFKPGSVPEQDVEDRGGDKGEPGNDDDGTEGDKRVTQGKGAKVDWGESIGTGALTYGAAGNYPAKYSFNAANPTPDCNNDYVVFTLPNATATRANLIAYKNLYVDNNGTGTCPGTLPVALFTYNASQNNGSLVSSPALSLDGKQIAFIENASSAQFHVVKWKAGNVAGTFGAPFNAAKMVNCATNGGWLPANTV